MYNNLHEIITDCYFILFYFSLSLFLSFSNQKNLTNPHRRTYSWEEDLFIYTIYSNQHHYSKVYILPYHRTQNIKYFQWNLLITHTHQTLLDLLLKNSTILKHGHSETRSHTPAVFHTIQNIIKDNNETRCVSLICRPATKANGMQGMHWGCAWGSQPCGRG